MICFIGLIVFAILGIFSASHRALAKEAFDCVFRRMTLRKCESAFDQKMKMKISTGLLKRSPTAGKFVHKHFELISWALTLSLILSLVFGVWGIYNYVTYGNCNGENSSEYCIYEDILTEEQCGLETCSDGTTCDYVDGVGCTGACECTDPNCEANHLAETFINKSLQNYVYKL